MIEAVVFDWGGTLSVHADVDLLDLWRVAAEHLAPGHAVELTERLLAVEAESWALTATTRRSTTLATLLRRATRELGLDVVDAVHEEAAERYLDSWTPHIRHDPHAGDALRALRARGLRIGLLSNTHWPRAFHEHFLARDGLDALIDARCYTSELEWVKPHPAAFTSALDALGVADPARAVFVGDRPYDDIHGARSAGLRAVLRPNADVPPYDVEPDARIAELAELLPLIDGWSG